MMYLLPRRAPFSDWCAQIERRIERRLGFAPTMSSITQVRSCYEVGLSANEVADDFIADVEKGIAKR